MHTKRHPIVGRHPLPANPCSLIANRRSPTLPSARVLAELHANIQDAFNKYGVHIMSPILSRIKPCRSSCPKGLIFTGGDSRTDREIV